MKITIGVEIRSFPLMRQISLYSKSVMVTREISHFFVSADLNFPNGNAIGC